MGFRSFGKGSVLRDSQVAPANSPSTGMTQTGVVRDARPVPAAYDLDADAPPFVDAAADQYRASVVEAPGTTPTEYLAWAANTADLAGPTNPDPSWWTETGYGKIPVSTATVGTFTDGATVALVTDNGNKDIGRIYAVVVARGDVADYDDDGWKDPDNTNPASYGGQARKGDNPYLTLYFEEGDQDPRLGMVYLTDAHITSLGGGLSTDRGDQIVVVHYTVSSARFWWSKNDRYETRFGWAAQSRRWEPFKGTAPQNLGVLKADVQFYSMIPTIKNLPAGSMLPSGAIDAYGMIRIGTSPSADQSVPVAGIVVRPDNETGATFPTAYNGRMGQSNGKLEFNQTFIEANLGKPVWYVPNTFHAVNDGIIGRMTDQELFIAPVPSMTEMPLIRFGSRKYLTATVVATDAVLSASPPPYTGNVLVSASTGKLRFNVADLEKADPTSQTFSKHFLGEFVVYDGVSLSAMEQPTRAPVQLLNAVGAPATAVSSELYIPAYVYLPTEFVASNTRRGLGTSGILDAPDGTGAVPDQVGFDASLRPGGDNTADVTTGRIRQVCDGVSDTILFTQRGSVESIIVVDTVFGVPTKIPGGTAYIVRKMGSHGSRVCLSPVDKARFGAKPIFFLQAAFNPASHTTKARMVSRNRSIFRFDGTETLRFAIDAVPHTWTSAGLLAANPSKTYFTTAEVVTDIGLPTVYVSAERIVIEATNPDTGSVEIGFGVGGALDLSGCKVLGFVPGWRAVGGVDNWLPDSGVSLGMYRTPMDPRGINGTADFRATDRVENQVLIDGIQALPFYFLNTVPLQDIAGIEEGVFFNLSTTVTDGDSATVINKNLEHYKDIIHRFTSKKFDWVQDVTVDGYAHVPMVTLNSGHVGIAPESFESAVGGGLYVSYDGGSATLLTRDTDYLIPQDGVTGNALLIKRFLSRVANGANGHMTAGSNVFADPNVDFTTTAAKVGDILSVQGADAINLYRVTNVTTVLEVTPTPTTTATVLWNLLSGTPDSDFDPALVADIQYMDFDHLPQETMVIRVLTPVAIPTSGGNPKALMSGALASGRTMAFRIGSASPSAITNLIPLRKIVLGFPHNGLMVPDTTDPRFINGRFVLQAGPTYTCNPQGVLVFSPDPNNVEYLTQDTSEGPKGTMKFGSAFMAQWSKVAIYYVDRFLDPNDLPQGTAEYDPLTGEFQPSIVDINTYLANPSVGWFFVEELITKGRKDVAINPILGAFSTNAPLTKGALVEVFYWQADLEGRKVGNHITEFLPVFVRNEVSTKAKVNVYTFNTALTHWVDQAIEPTVYIGPIRQNYGQLDYILDYPSALKGAGQITFVSHRLDPNVDVRVSYAVFDMSGGERSFEVSTKPVYRPPFYIGANQDRFGLKGDRMADFVPGQMLRIGDECFYVKSLKYYPQNATNTGDVTAVYIYPPTINEVGSRAPGNDVLTVITNGPVTTVVDPDGKTPVATTAPTGLQWDAADFQNYPIFEPIVRGQKTWTLYGPEDLGWPIGSILEIGGVPYTVSGFTFDTDGSRVYITVTSAFRSNLTQADHPTIKVTYRPVYPPGAEDFVGVGAILPTEDCGVCIVDSAVPGRALTTDVDCSIDPPTGNIHIPGGITATQKIIVKFTRLDALKPSRLNGVPVTPWYTASFLAQEFPDESNGILNGKLAATYTFASPDAFYFRAVPLRTFVVEIIEEVSAEIDGQQPASGVLSYTAGGTKNWQNGSWDLLGERRALMDKDRVARTFLEYYNSVIVAFEQVGETITGGFVGDKDGKFHFWVGHDNEWPKPGYEDPITGYLTMHLVWPDIVNQINPLAQYCGLLTDPVVDPTTINVVSGAVAGGIVSSNTLTGMIRKQRGLVFNDVDDVVLVSLGHVTLSFTTSAPYFSETIQGLYKAVGDEHGLSRLFPTITKAMIRTLPGIGAAPGVYSAGFFHNGELAATAGDSIAQLRNPVVGDITNVSGATLHKRRARARIWGWFPNGLPASAFGVAILAPCIIAVPDLLRDIRILPETGYPDPSQFISVAVTGTLPDAEAGDPELAIPGFAVGDQIAWGQPNGTVYPSYNHLDSFTIFGFTTYTGVFVQDVQYGCVITFQAANGATIIDPNAIYAGDTSITNLPIAQGDTIFVGSPTASFTVAPSDPAEFSTLQAMSARMDTYRDGFDVRVTSNGTLIDLSLPSKADGTYLYLKELFGQNAPEPMDALEGPVSFALGNQNPLLVPALEGKVQDDSGDYQIPYLRSSNTEMDRFAGASLGLSAVYGVDDSGHSMYPDEIVGTDGAIVATVGAAPATMTTAHFTQPAYAGGVAPVRSFDLVLTQISGVNPFSTDGVLGITTMGALDDQHWIEPPRFVTPTTPPTPGSEVTDPMTYIVENAMVYVDGNYPTHPQIGSPPNGVYLIVDVPNNRTILDFGTTTLALNDGQTIGVGNLNYLRANNAIITIQLIARQDADIINGPGGILPSTAPGGQVALTFVIRAASVSVTDYNGGTAGAILATTVFGTHTGAPLAPVINNRQIIIPMAISIDFGPGPGTPAQWFLPHTVAAGPIYTTLYGFEYIISVDMVAPGIPFVSNTAWISDDRMTFNEVYDLSFAKKRGYVHPQSGISLETKLSIYDVTVGLTLATQVMSSINRWQNGAVGPDPIPYTFVPRTDANTVGQWAARAGGVTERGRLKVMAYEGHGNTPITTISNATFSVIPSDDRCALGPILTGWGKTASQFTILSGYTTQRFDNRITEIHKSSGLEDHVEPGDILVVTGSADTSHVGCHQTGTYLVRHAVKALADGDAYVTKAPVTYAGLGSGWCPLHFPTVVSFNVGTEVLLLSDDAPADGGPGGSGFAVPVPGVTRIYIVRNVNGLASTDPTTFKYSVISAEYTAKLGSAFLLTGYKDALGVGMTTALFGSKLGKPYQVSGMTYWPVNVAGAQYSLPDNNCVGFDSESSLPVPALPYTNWAIYGFHLLSFIPQGALASAVPPAATQTWTADEAIAAAPYILKAAGTPKCVVPMEGPVATTYQFQANSMDPMYHWVVRTLNVSDVEGAQWDSLNVPAGSAGGGGSLVRCILPGTKLALSSGVADGYYAQTGVFLEPTFPRSSLNSVGANARIVDATHSLPNPDPQDDQDREVGMRDGKKYQATVAVPDEVSFTVRRIRRFHEVLDTADANLMPLRYAYEIRRGIITAYMTDNKQLGQVSAIGFMWTDGNTYTGTQLGTFANADVNINAGDIFRVLDADGHAVEEVRIAAVKAPGLLVLDAPGLQTTITPGTTHFQVFLKKAPVPHEQSGEELLEIITDKRICNTVANWTTQKGGYVPDITGATTYANAVNRLYDDLNAPNPGDFAPLGIKKGDIVIIDPAGAIPLDGGLPVPQEVGRRPLGDEGVPARAPGVYVAGTPSPLDDNRGFYRVKSVVDTANPPYLSVTPINTYAGDETAPVVFADDPYACAVYPTVTDSTLKKAPYPVGNGKEAQMTLRPTLKRDAITKSFSNRTDGFIGHSIRPFSYHVIRPTKMLSDEAIDLVLMMRERMLSLIELLRYATLGLKHGSYFVFQRDEHIKEVGSPTDPDLGLGLSSNLFLEAIGGRMDVTPYANNAGCLSVLDRRVWVHDTRLDSLTSDGHGGMKTQGLLDTAYTAYTATNGSKILPALPERIDEVLDTQDKLRLLRYVWLSYRTHKILGTLSTISRFDGRLKEAQKAQKAKILQKASGIAGGD